MTTPLATVGLLPRALDATELELVSAAGHQGASFGALVGWVLGEGIAIAASVVTANPGPVIAYQILTASAGVAVGYAVGN